MISSNNKQPVRIHAHGKNIIAVHAFLHDVWKAFGSCFGSGVWMGSLPWVGSDAWKGL